MLKPGGYLVYSTCTITIEENEEQISWLVNKHKNMIIVDQVKSEFFSYFRIIKHKIANQIIKSPFHMTKRQAIQFKDIDFSEEQLNKLQRFMPSYLLSNSKYNDEISLGIDENRFLSDSNGFFIAKLFKLNE